MRSAVLVLLAVAALAGCQAIRVREFPADRAGASEAIAVVLKQSRPGAVEFKVRKEPSTAPRGTWKESGYLRADEVVTGVVMPMQSGGDPATRMREFAGSREGLAEAQAFAKSQGDGPAPNLRVRVPYSAAEAEKPHAWGWLSGHPNEIAPFDSGVCIRDDCVDYADVRVVWAMGGDRQAGPFPATRDGLVAAVRDPATSQTVGRVAVEVRMAADRVWKPSYLYSVSVLEDQRICGQAGEFPLAAIERCYDYAQIESFTVSDQTSTLVEAMTDTVTFPFGLVGAAARSAAIGAH